MKICKVRPDHSTCSACLATQEMCNVVDDCSKCKLNTERLRELFGSLSKVVEPGKPIKVTDYRCHRDFYVRAEYTYIPIFRRNMPYHRRNF